MSNWVTESDAAANAERARRATIAKQIDTLWKNVCLVLEQTADGFRTVSGGDAKFGGAQPFVVTFVVYDKAVPPVVEPAIRESAEFTLDRDQLVIRVAFSSGRQSMEFPIDVDNNGAVFLWTPDGKRVNAEGLVRLALEPAMYPVLHDGRGARRPR